LPASSFLLEIFVSDKLYYQREIESLQSNVLLAIPVGNYELVGKCTLDERTNKPLDGPEFQGRVTLQVGDIDDDLRPNEEPLVLTIRQDSRTLARNTLTPPKLISSFTYGNRRYTLAGMVRKIGQISKLDCEIYRMRG
jgi:hypothetical protein